MTNTSIEGGIDDFIRSISPDQLPTPAAVTESEDYDGASFDSVSMAASLLNGEEKLETTRDLVRQAIEEAFEKQYQLIQDSQDAGQTKGLNSITIEERSLMSDILEVPYDFDKLEGMVDKSPILKACLDAYVTNANFGFDLKTHKDIVSKKVIGDDGTEQLVATWRETGEVIPEDVLQAMQAEHNRLVMFFNNVSMESSFNDLCFKRSVNMEQFGNAYWECETDGDGNYVGFEHVDTKTVRLLRKDPFMVAVDYKQWNPITMDYDVQRRRIRFRRYVQLSGTHRIYFKQFRDPRMMDSRTGRYLRFDNGDWVTRDNIDRFPREKIPQGFNEATELIHFSIYHTKSSYGVPRFVSSTKNIYGVHLADMVNFNLLNGNAIPPVMVIVEGTRDQRIQKMITEHVEKNIKGPQSYSKMLVIQVDSKLKGTSSGLGSNVIKPTIKIERLSDVMSVHGLFMEYIKQSEERILSNFRLPNVFVGKNNDITRSTAEISKEISEEQVFRPLRDKFDEIVNSTILNALEIKYWRFESRSSKLNDNAQRGKLIEIFARWGGLMPIDVRREAAMILNRTLEDIPEPFMHKPIDISKAEVRSGRELRNDPDRMPGAPAEDNLNPVPATPVPAVPAAVIEPTEKQMVVMQDITKTADGAKFLRLIGHEGASLFVYDHEAAKAA